LTGWFFSRLSLLGIFLRENPVEKTMNCSSEYKKTKKGENFYLVETSVDP